MAHHQERQFNMPDTSRYTSVSVTRKAHTELTKLQEQLQDEHSVDFSLAKVIEKLATEGVRKNEQQ